MGLLDQILGGLMGGSGGASPVQGVLMNLLGGGQQGQLIADAGCAKAAAKASSGR